MRGLERRRSKLRRAEAKDLRHHKRAGGYWTDREKREEQNPLERSRRACEGMRRRRRRLRGPNHAGKLHGEFPLKHADRRGSQKAVARNRTRATNIAARGEGAQLLQQNACQRAREVSVGPSLRWLRIPHLFRHPQGVSRESSRGQHTHRHSGTQSYQSHSYWWRQTRLLAQSPRWYPNWPRAAELNHKQRGCSQPVLVGVREARAWKGISQTKLPKSSELTTRAEAPVLWGTAPLLHVWRPGTTGRRRWSIRWQRVLP